MKNERLLALIGKNNKSNKPVGLYDFPTGPTEDYAPQLNNKNCLIQN